MRRRRTAPSAVLDANGIIGLAKSGCFALIPRLFGSLYLPPLVALEVTDPASRAELDAALQSWLHEEVPSLAALSRVPQHKSDADRHVLALALDHRPALIVTGDRGLESKARRLQIAAINAPAVIQLLAQVHLIPGAKPHLDQMRQSGFGIAQALYEQILRTLGE